ncbi:hypothetical protein G6024_14310, partial [Dietzia maris]|nr:hypothetical protein [Dietzia maris]
MRHFNRGVGAAVLAVSLVGTTVACTSDPGDGGPRTEAAPVEGTRVAADADGSGVETTRLLIESAPVVVVAAPDAAAQARAASVAVGLHAPMLTAVEGGDAALADEVSRLGAERVLRVGQVAFTPDDGEVVDAPGGRPE